MSNNLALIWPGLAPFGLSEENRRAVEGCLVEKKCTTQFQRHVCHHFVEVSAKPIGSGAHTKVYKYYNPVSGSYVAGKTFNSSHYEKAKSTYRLLAGKEHCAQMLHFCDHKKMIFEELYTGPDLYEVLPLLKSSDDKVNAICQIASGILGIHSVEIDKYPLSHRDLKPANILFSFFEGGDFKADIGDFGSMTYFHCLTTSPGFESPGLCAFNPEKRCEGDVRRYNFTYGRKDDLFSFGLICLIILKGSMSHGRPPLDFVTKMAKMETEQRFPLVAKITQEELDKDLDKAMDGVSDPTLVKVWKIVREHLLRVDPKEITDIGSFVKMVEPPQKTERDLSASLEPKIPFQWSGFSLTPEAQKDVEHQILRYMARRQDNEPTLSTGLITLKGQPYTFKYELLYNGKHAFINTAELLHEGGIMTSYKAFSPITGKFYALKIQDEYDLVAWTYEKLENKKNCVHSTYRDGKRYIVEPLYPNTLTQVLNQKLLKTPEAKLNAMRQIAKGLANIHSESYINRSFEESLSGNMSHRRLSPNTIFVSDSYDISCGKIAYLLKNGRNEYIAPEERALPWNISNKDYCSFAHHQGAKIDIWQLGQIFGRILLNDNQFFNGTYLQKVQIANDSSLSEKEKEALTSVWNLVFKMLQSDPAIRCDIHQVVLELSKVSHV